MMMEKQTLIIFLFSFLLISLKNVFGDDDVGGVCTKLRRELMDIRLHGEPPKPEEIRKLFIDGCGNDYDEMNRDFPFAFMEEITSMRLDFYQPLDLGYPAKSWVKYREFEETQLDKIRKLIGGGILKHKFSLRHYSKEKRPSVRSNFALWYDKSVKGTKTLGKDWNFLGDTAFTFWWLCVDGQVPTGNQKFIDSSKYYDEIQITEKGLKDRGLWDVDFFASTDLMGHADLLQNFADRPIMLRGKLQNLPEIVFGYFLLTNKVAELPLDEVEGSAEKTVTKLMMNTINKVFPVFEVKIPGTVKNTDWKDKPNKE